MENGNVKKAEKSITKIVDLKARWLKITKLLSRVSKNGA
jgi:hypothetical protein